MQIMTRKFCEINFEEVSRCPVAKEWLISVRITNSGAHTT